MLKFFFKIALVILILFGIGNVTNYIMTGNTPDIEIPNLTDALSEKLKSIKDKKLVNDSYLYKWRDDKGIIHYSSEKPIENIRNLEQIKLSSDTNIVPAVSETEVTNNTTLQQLSEPTSTDFPENVYSPAAIEQLIDQAKDTQNLMNEQFDQQESIINSQ
jgi:predicted component of viral defense system (DUF524 family)